MNRTRTDRPRDLADATRLKAISRGTCEASALFPIAFPALTALAPPVARLRSALHGLIRPSSVPSHRYGHHVKRRYHLNQREEVD